MFQAALKFQGVKLNQRAVNDEAARLAEQVAETLVRNAKLAMVAEGAIASGETMRGIRKRLVTARRASGLAVASTTLIKYEVIAPKGFKYIVSGRRAGAKMPVRMVGTGKRGGKIFEPLPALVKWFNVLGIPPQAWFPILRAISRRGIKPRNVPARAVREAMPAVRRLAGQASVAIARGIITRANK